MRGKRVLCSGLLLLMLFFTIAPALADNGGYYIIPRESDEFYDSETRSISFWELPLWIQMFYLSGAIAFLVAIVKLIPFIFLKLRKKKLNQNMELVYQHINDNPGCTVSDISKEGAINVGIVRYHVDQLHKTRKIMMVKFRKFVRLFRNSGAYNDRDVTVISAMRIQTNRAIILLIRDQPGLSNKQIAERLCIKESMAHIYLADLLRDNIIDYEKNRQQKKYYLKNDIKTIIDKISDTPTQQNQNTTI